ncbi:MAG: hypothetical protein ACK2U9_05355 [Anaerolineae bacterium]
MKTRIPLALALILVLVVAGSAPVAAAGATVPFRAALQTYPEETGFDPATGILTMDVPGEGRATHLGRSVFESTAYINTYSPLPYPQLTYGTLIAANGDRLNVDMAGTVVPFAGEGSWEVSAGGTGRFAGVTGAGIYWYGFDGEEWHLYFEGTLTKP